MTHHNDAIPSAAPPNTTATQGRRPEEIEHEIQSIRARMDTVIDEIEFRLSPGQMSGGVVQVVRDVIQGGGDGLSGRIARAVRANPIPVALMGVGALWLAVAIARTPESTTEFDDYDPHGRHLDPRSRHLLTDLIAACRDGSEAFRRADMTIADTALSARLEDLADQLDRSAMALDAELRTGGGWIETAGDGTRVWSPTSSPCSPRTTRPSTGGAIRRTNVPFGAAPVTIASNVSPIRPAISATAAVLRMRRSTFLAARSRSLHWAAIAASAASG